MAAPPGDEVVDAAHGLVLRRVVVGPLETNCWIVRPLGGREVLVVDPGADATRIAGALAGLSVAGIVLTHTHFDHVLGLPGLLDVVDAPLFAHPAEAEVWAHELDHLSRVGHFDGGTATAELLAADPHALDAPDEVWGGRFEPVTDGFVWRLACGLEVAAVHTPGHTPGGLTLRLPGHLLTGDTLFPGGPGLTGWPLSDFPTIMTSVRGLLTEPPATAVHPGHGRDTTIGAERPQVEEWQRRGW